MKQIAPILLFICFFIFVIFLINKFQSDVDEDIYNNHYNGIIINKFIDKSNHSVQTLTIKDGTIKHNILIFNELSTLWAAASIGDSIVKKQNSYKHVLFIFQDKDTLKYEFEYSKK